MAAITQAGQRVLGRYATFEGRATRPEFWWWSLLLFLVQIVTQSLDALVFGPVENGGAALISPLVGLALLLPALAVAVRRLHDTGRSGWWLLLLLIPIIGGLVLVYFYIQPSDRGTNAFGAPDPLPAG